jgi:hypothetical protein
MEIELLISKNRSIKALVSFLIIFPISVMLIYNFWNVVSYPTKEKEIYVFTFLFHWFQFIVIITVFYERFSGFTKIKTPFKAFFWSILFVVGTGWYPIQYFYYHLIKYDHYYDKEVQFFGLIYFIFLLAPIMTFFLDDFIIGKEIIDKDKYLSRKGILNKLLKHGSISESEYNSKMIELNQSIVKSEIVISEEFKNLQKQLKKGNITTLELENYVFEEIRKRNLEKM